MPNPAILILAAGASRRLGRPKQMLDYKGRTLLDYTIYVAKETKLGQVYVVIGSRSEEISRLDDVIYIYNAQWSEGMGNSLACGVKQVRETDVSGLIVMQCDQPYVSVTLLHCLAACVVKSGKGIVLCDYGSGYGPPTYFSEIYFDVLSKLNDDKGAKSIVKAHQFDVEYLSFPEGRHDIDTESDLDLLM